LHYGHGFSLDVTALVIQSHIIAMYLPSLFTGLLLERLGLLRVMLAGVICLLGCVTLGLVGRELLHYWAALVLLGLGWNLLFVGATVLLTRSYRPSERFKAQAVNESTIFGAQAVASLSAGTVLFFANWHVLMLISLAFVSATLAGILLTRRRMYALAG
jgi:MFS family permease